MGSGHKVPEIGNIHFERLSNKNANQVKNIPNKIDLVKEKMSKIEAKASTNHPAAKFPQMPETTA